MAYTHALQFLLNTVEPVCIKVQPSTKDIGMVVSYTVTGVNEDQVTFTATQNAALLASETMKRDASVQVMAKGKQDVELCWTKLDKKAKKVNFLISQPEIDYNKKATQETVEDLTN